MRLHKQIAIVTGGGQGIGREIALRLSQEGATVVIGDINTQGAAETVETISHGSNGKAISVPTDLIHEDQVVRLVNAAMEVSGRIDILVNNSGIAGPMKNIEDITAKEWDETMAVNVRGMFFCCRHTIPIMKRQNQGSIVNIASVTGKRALTQRTPYATSKMGVIGFTRTLAAEVGPWNIRINAVCPGIVSGLRLEQVFQGIARHTGKSRDRIAAERVENTALKRFVDPKDIAALVAFLCSEDAATMTGQDINVSAGSVMY
jgi:NAD(P)-dependent dehydrogenase (short-subunit alcohol dehydrogenase family)